MINNKKKFRVGIYLRLSNEDKFKIDNISESIKNQRYLLLDYINKKDNFVLVDEYVDENLSGAGTYRPEFERLIRDCENKKIDIVLCKSQSRFSRDVEVIEKYIHNKFIEWNIRFIGLSDNADTEIQGNKKARQINGLVNEWYLEDVSNNIRSAFRAKMLNGEFISPFCVYGYKIDDNDNNKLIIDGEVYNIVKKIFMLYLSGLGYIEIAKYLNNNNIPSPSYYKYLKGIKLNVISNKPRNKIMWSSSSVKAILTNEIYIGNLIQGKRTTISYKNHKVRKKNTSDWIKVTNTHEAIIEEDIFYKVQKIIKDKTKVNKTNNKRHILSGKVICGLCGSKMRKKNSGKHNYLICSNGQYNMCDNKVSIRYDKLEIIVLNSINELVEKFFDKDILINIFNNSNFINKKVINLEKLSNDLKDKLNMNYFYIKKLYEEKICNNILESRFKELINDYEKMDKIYKNKIIYLDRVISIFKNKQENISKNIFDKYKNFDKLDSVLVTYFIDKIIINKIDGNDRKIDIKWLI